MRRMIAAALLAAGCAGSSTTAAHVSSEHTTPPPAVVPDAHPAVRYGQSCDYLLGNFTQTGQGYRFIARAELRNTGNVGAAVRVVASWVQVGSGDVIRTRTVRVPYHRSRSVNFSVVVSSDQISQIQAYSGSANCHVRARIVSTYGEAH